MNGNEVQLIDLRQFRDARGWLCETLPGALLNELRPAAGEVQQVNTVASHKGILRGLHFQAPPHAQGKLIVCLQGEILDVAVDLRRQSPHFAQSRAEVLKPFEKAMFVPAGFAHGFQSLSENSLVQYVIFGAGYAPQSEAGLHPLCPELQLPWHQEPILNPRDQTWPQLKDFQSPFE